MQCSELLGTVSNGGDVFRRVQLYYLLFYRYLRCYYLHDINCIISHCYNWFMFDKLSFCTIQLNTECWILNTEYWTQANQYFNPVSIWHRFFFYEKIFNLNIIHILIRNIIRMKDFIEADETNQSKVQNIMTPYPSISAIVFNSNCKYSS